jgi:hypothetical protein
MFAQHTTTTDQVPFNFAHQLAKLTVVITDGTNAISGATWQIKDGIYTGSIVPSTGVVTTSTTLASMTSAKLSGAYLLLPAQNLLRYGTLSVTANGVNYNINLRTGWNYIALKQGANTTLTLVADGKNITVKGGCTTSWSAELGNYATDQYMGCTYSGHGWMQLKKGGTKWATEDLCLSPSSPSTTNTFAWGAMCNWFQDTSSKTYGSNNPWSESNLSGYYSGTETTLPASNDIATILWGSAWRMPTADEFKELLNLDGDDTDNYQWKGQGGDVCYVTCTDADKTDNGLSFTSGSYWSSTTCSGATSNAYSLRCFYSGQGGVCSESLDNDLKIYGEKVRPVFTE